MKLCSTIVWRDVRYGVGSGLDFSKWGDGESYDLYHPLEVNVRKYQINLLQN